MNYYPFHIGDYITHTAHLSPLEDIAYRRLLDLYYQTEGALTGDVQRLSRLIRMREHEQEVAHVLDEFFTCRDERWFHARCDAELMRMTDKQAKARASAEASVNARKVRAKQMLGTAPAVAERPLNARSTQAVLPTPTPSIPRPSPIETAASDAPSASSAGRASKAMRDAGLHDANPAHPLLGQLLAEGATLQELAYAAEESVRRGKGFAYALTMAAGRRREAVKCPAGGAQPIRRPQVDNFDAKDYGERVTLV
ncbi:YdaU family protein [Lampropedia aestuarii]|uniref:YdaU family protein n=1 Tax=Lampropedia aestuarii TaxID=2562762 RepID=UPI0024690C76|nr:YdaU family protein [Lampropedia aestuarii]MDH5858995.1 YdaU family protein [Lampropedia aestuarii]